MEQTFLPGFKVFSLVLRFSVWVAFFVKGLFLGDLPFVGTTDCPVGLARLCFLPRWADPEADFCGDCIARRVTLEGEDWVFALVFVVETEEIQSKGGEKTRSKWISEFEDILYHYAGVNLC